MRQISKYIAVLAFFGLALVGWLSDVPLLVCSLRALAGAGVMYILAVLLGRFVIHMLVDSALAEARERQNHQKDQVIS